MAGEQTGDWLADDDALAQADLRLEIVLRQIEAGVPVSFAAGESSPESELRAELATREQAPAEDDRDLLDKLLAQLAARSGVETRDRAGRVLASSHFDVSGDLTTQLHPDADPRVLRRHLRTLERKLEQQQRHRRMIASALNMAMKIAAATGTGNPLLALPTAWRFIRQVAADMKQSETSR